MQTKYSDMVRDRYCGLCPDNGTRWCERCCVVAVIIGDLEEMEDEDETYIKGEMNK